MRMGTLKEELKRKRVVAVTDSEWEHLAGFFKVLQRHDALPAGSMLVVESEGVLAAVEPAEPAGRVIRLLSDLEEAQRFVEYRIRQYDRMWDGCGCKIDYFSPDWGK